AGRRWRRSSFSSARAATRPRRDQDWILARGKCNRSPRGDNERAPDARASGARDQLEGLRLTAVAPLIVVLADIAGFDLPALRVAGRVGQAEIGRASCRVRAG